MKETYVYGTSSKDGEEFIDEFRFIDSNSMLNTYKEGIKESNLTEDITNQILFVQQDDQRRKSSIRFYDVNKKLDKIISFNKINTIIMLVGLIGISATTIALKIKKKLNKKQG